MRCPPLRSRSSVQEERANDVARELFKRTVWFVVVWYSFCSCHRHLPSDRGSVPNASFDHAGQTQRCSFSAPRRGERSTKLGGQQMPRTKPAPKKSRGTLRKASKATRKSVKAANKAASKATKRARRTVAKVATAMKKRAQKVASNPRRTVRKAADNVHQTATRAREMGESVVTAGELLRGTADFVDSVAQRAKARAQQGTRPRRSR